ncbi:hypothetical protein SLS55_003755 [Diplodia seriata]|uniref:Uncharacterized protein n=1 Tax=Diplodia seriata TaxID=420778 RepID=A0ABR3CNX8_9PEZI
MVKEQPNRDLVASLGVDSAFLQLQQENFRKARLTMKQTSVVAFFETQETPTVQNRMATTSLQWKESELQELIQNALASCADPLCILVDALDEAGKQTAVDLVKWFGRLTKVPNIRIIFSCRYYPILPTISKLAISMEDENAEDIDRIVGTELRSEFNENEAQILENDIIQKANGMFQWATLVTNSVVETYRETGQSLDALRDMIGRLPPDLHALYDSLLGTLQGSEKNQAIKLLNWILFAVAHLELHDLQHALVIDTNTTAGSVSEIPKSPLFVDVSRAVKTLSRGLAEVKGHDDRVTVQFIHQSVLDYLKADGLAKLIGVGKRSEAFGYAHFQLSRSCIRYLMMEDLVDAINDLEHDPDTGMKRLLEEFPLAGYARCFWVFHTIIAEIYEYDQQDLLEILPWIREDKIPFHFTVGRGHINDDNEIYSLIVEGRLKSDALPAKRKNGPPDIQDTNYFNLINAWDNCFLFRDRKPFNLFALAGIRCVWKQLLAEFEEDDRTLHRGVPQDFPGTLEVSCCDPGLEHGSPPQVRGFEEPSPLLCLLLGNLDIKLEEIPGRLIDACINDWYHVTPLFCAVAMERGDLVGAFINAGASIDPSCDDFTGYSLSAYENAIVVENVGIIRQMIDAYGKGPPTDHAESALHFAIHEGKNVAITMLIEHCSNRYTAEEFINFWSDEHKETPLLAALRKRNLKVCQKLIGAGADVETSGDGRSLLLHCVQQGFAGGVSLLLENGADPNRGWPMPLMEAMSRSDKDVIKLLLEDPRTDPNRTDTKALAAIMRMLLEAYERGHNEAGVVEMAKFCVSPGISDLETKDERGETLLSKAVTTMHPEVVDILLADEQADPNTRGTCGWTPLMKSAFMGYRTTTQLLLSCANIEIEAQDCWGKTALYYAVIKSKMACANLILRHSKADLLSSKVMLSSECFEAAKQGEEDFLAHLSDLRPSWLGQSLASEIYTRARNENQGRIIRRLEEAGFVLQEDVVMTGAP